MNRIERIARTLGTDTLHAARTLRRNLLFTAAVVGTLALGAGAATAVFSVVDAILIRPLPYDQADRWVELGHPENPNARLTPAQLEAWRDEASTVADAWLGYTSLSRNRTDGAASEMLSVLAVTPGATELLGLPMVAGRPFTSEDAASGASVALLSESYFDRMGRDPGILGSTLRLDSGPVTIVGVVSESMKFPVSGDVRQIWVPIGDDFTAAGSELTVIQGTWARLREGLTRAQAQERADRVATGLQETRPREGGWAVSLDPLDDFRANRRPRQALWILSATVGMILLVAFLNGANLFGIRSVARARELDIRAAVGASRGRILRQMLLESLFLGLLAGFAALALGWLAFRGVEGMIPSDLRYFSVNRLGFEGRTLAFAFVASLAGGAVLGLLPGWTLFRRSARGGVQGSMDDSPASRRVRGALVVGQVALSTVLLVGAVLFADSFGRLIGVDPGFDHERLAQGIVAPSPESYPEAADRAALFQRYEEALEAHPAVEGATIGGGTSLHFSPLQAEGREPRSEEPLIVPVKDVAPDYFEVTGTELVAGRPFQPGDEGTDLAIVDRDLALFLWGSENAVGRRFRIGDGPWMEIVGVTRDLRLRGRNQEDGPHQVLTPRTPGGTYNYTEIDVRTAGSPAALLPVMRTTLASVDRGLAYFRLRTATAALGESEETNRFLALLMTILGGIAVTLAAVGVFGVLGYSVRRREREMGVRSALGAGRRRIIGMVLGDGLLLGGFGVVLGIAGALYLGGMAGDLLFQVDPRDPRLLLGAALFFLAVIATAAFFPARRAASVDPVESLRAE